MATGDVLGLSLWAFVGVLQLLFGATWIAAARLSDTLRRALLAMAWFNLMLGTSLLLVGWRGEGPYFLTHTVSNLMQVVGCVLLRQAGCGLTGAAPRRAAPAGAAGRRRGAGAGHEPGHGAGAGGGEPAGQCLGGAAGRHPGGAAAAAQWRAARGVGGAVQRGLGRHGPGGAGGRRPVHRRRGRHPLPRQLGAGLGAAGADLRDQHGRRLPGLRPLGARGEPPAAPGRADRPGRWRDAGRRAGPGVAAPAPIGAARWW